MNLRRSLLICCVALVSFFFVKAYFFPLTSARAGAAPLASAYQTGAVIRVNSASGAKNVAGVCTLRDAITTANSGTPRGGCQIVGTGPYSIALDANLTITLTEVDNTTAGATGLPVISNVMEIRANGSIIERSTSAPAFRLFHSTAPFFLYDAWLRNGLAQGSAGGIGQGGCINATADLLVQGSTISDCKAQGGNSATGPGGGAIGGGIYMQTTSGDTNRALSLYNSTISGNHALGGTGNTGAVTPGLGGGVFVLNGDQEFQNITLSDNTANVGGGFYAQANRAPIGRTAWSATIRNSIFANSPANVSDIYFAVQNAGSFDFAGSEFNLVELNPLVAANALPGSPLSGDPLLEPLKLTAPGKTPTHALKHDSITNNISPAIDKGGTPRSGLTSDQHGLARTYDVASVANAASGDGTDIGAFEATPVEVGGNLGGAIVDKPFSTQLTATPAGPTYTFSVPVFSMLPAGLTLSSSGVLSGTPTRINSQTFQVIATSNTGESGMSTLTLYVGCPTITVSPATPTAATVGTPYSQQLTAGGGKAPYTFSVSSNGQPNGGLPPGLSLSANGVLSGVPTAASNYFMGIKVTDANNCFLLLQAYTVTVNPPPAPVAGRLGALSLPGTNADANLMRYVDFATAPNVQTFPALTVEAWVKLGSATGRYDILTRAPLFFYVEDGKVSLRLNGLTNTNTFQANALLLEGVWTHVAATWNGSQAQLFINGVNRGTFATTGPLTNETQPLSLGYCNTGASPAYGFKGELDEIRLWRVARTATEIADKQGWGLLGNESGLEAYWRFDELSGTAVLDASGHGFAGTLNAQVTRVNADNFVTNLNTAYSGKFFAYATYSTGLKFNLITQGNKGTVALTNAATGEFTYTPNNNATGTDYFHYSATNGAESNLVLVNVTIKNTNAPPTVTLDPPLTLVEGFIGTVPIATINDDITPAGSLTVSVTPEPATSGIIPLTLTSNINGKLTQYLMVQCGAAASSTLKLTVSDSLGGTTVKSLSVTVARNQAPALAYAPSYVVAAGGSLTVNPTDGPRDDYGTPTIGLWTITPVGSTTNLSGTKTVSGAGVVNFANANPAGNYTVTIRALDQTSCASTTFASFTLTVGCPLATSLTWNTLSAASQGIAYTGNVAVSGLPGAVVYSLAAGSVLPQGLSLAANGALTGVPTTVGTFNFTINATSGGCSFAKAYTLTVNCAAPVITLPLFSVAATYGTNATFNVQATGVGLTYQWRKGGVVLADSASISGARTASLTLSQVTPADQGQFDVVVTSACGLSTTSTQANLYVGQPPDVQPLTSSSLLINEFRFSGPSGADDWYVELYNNTDNAIGTSGMKLNWINAQANQAGLITLGEQQIQPRGYYLIAGSNYSLGRLTLPDVTVAALDSIGQLGGVRLYDATGAVLDAAGTTALQANGQTGGQNQFYENTPVAALGVTLVQHAWVRKQPNTAVNTPADTNNNQADFVLVATTGELPFGVVPKIGAPGPQNLASPPFRNAKMPAALFDPLLPSASAPNFLRDLTPLSGSQGNYALGSFYLRRTFTNNTGAPVIKLRLHVIDITDGSVTGQANIRAIDAADITVNGKPVKGVTLDAPSQLNGGGLNSSLTVRLSEPIPVGSKVNVQFRLGVLRGGSYRFYVNVEATN